MSNPQVKLKDIISVKFSRVYNTADFDCGDKDINDFLKNDALTHQEEMIANTILFLHHDKILGFCSLTADAIKMSKCRVSAKMSAFSAYERAC
ncbi:hypothetical protein HY992_02555 [Candidatus Micrarchaeota archaeon]|nr:hypothetical protein [Candidatus Micrarchaeota archaeon]